MVGGQKISTRTTGEKNPNHKLTESQVIEIKKLIKNGFSDKYIQNLYQKVSNSTIQDIRLSRSWKHLR